MNSRFKYFSIILALVLISCDEPFTPKGPFEQEIAVFGILSNRSDTQYVRVLKTYNPSGFNPYDVPQDQVIRGATVTVSQGGSVVQYRETTVPRTDTSRFDDRIVAYMAFPYKVQTGKTHTLDVMTLSDGSVHASVTVPDTGYLKLLNPLMLSLTRVAEGTAEDLIVQGFISPTAYGCMITFFIEYDILENAAWVHKRVEVPRTIIVVDSTQYYAYPKLAPRVSVPGLLGSLQIEGATYPAYAYKQKLRDLKTQYGNDIWIRRALFVLTQVERNFYAYYNIANGYQDAISIRTDLPDWTNITGGLGIFGAIVTDSVYYDIVD